MHNYKELANIRSEKKMNLRGQFNSNLEGNKMNKNPNFEHHFLLYLRTSIFSICCFFINFWSSINRFFFYFTYFQHTLTLNYFLVSAQNLFQDYPEINQKHSVISQITTKLALTLSIWAEKAEGKPNTWIL